MADQQEEKKPGKSKVMITIAGVCLAVGIIFAGLYYAINLSPVGYQEDKTSKLPLKTETLFSYLEDPSTCAADLSDRYQSITLTQKNDTIYDINLETPDQQPVKLKDVDLRIFAPQIPEIAKGDDFLTHITLQQRELNRNDTTFVGIMEDGSDVNVSNNCLRAGLWETYVTRRSGDDQGKVFHGWFEFPQPVYAGLFKKVNGFDFKPYENALQHYLRPDGNKVNLAHLRTPGEEKEIDKQTIDFHHDDPIAHLGEQQHKAKLIANTNLLTYKDIYKKENQPIKLMQFDEPGIYKKEKILKFDFSFLKEPKSVKLRKAKNDRLGKEFNELELTFPYGKKDIVVKNWPFLIKRNGLRIILGGWTLEDIPEAQEQPISAGDFGRFTFGIGTPDIYVDYGRRLEELEKQNNIYLILVDQDDNYVDNHTLGLDQVYISRLPDGTFVMYLVSYERIMLVAHWNFTPDSGLLLEK
ncbi:MAG: hypothetical protein K8F91_22945 [Candidatus Obscuribacterales bacterium]|nr:hypothetical protein [Candidatus Obscuribacterales bacterium]